MYTWRPVGNFNRLLQILPKESPGDCRDFERMEHNILFFGFVGLDSTHMLLWGVRAGSSYDAILERQSSGVWIRIQNLCGGAKAVQFHVASSVHCRGFELSFDCWQLSWDYQSMVGLQKMYCDSAELPQARLASFSFSISLNISLFFSLSIYIYIYMFLLSFLFLYTHTHINICMYVYIYKSKLMNK